MVVGCQNVCDTHHSLILVDLMDCSYFSIVYKCVAVVAISASGIAEEGDRA